VQYAFRAIDRLRGASIEEATAAVIQAPTLLVPAPKPF